MLAEMSTVYTEERERGPTITADEARAAYRKAFSEEQEDDLATRSPSTTRPAVHREIWSTGDANSYVKWFLALRSLANLDVSQTIVRDSRGGIGWAAPAARSDRNIIGGGGGSTLTFGSRVVRQVRPLAAAVWHGGDVELGFGDPLREYDDAALATLVAREEAAQEIAAEIAELRTEALDEGLEINAASVAVFGEFVRRYQPTAVPALAVLDNGNIRAMWKRANGEQVGLQFRADGDIQFVSFVLRGRQLASNAGRDTTDGVIQRLKADGLIDLVTG